MEDQLMNQLIWKTSKYWRSVTYHQPFEISLFDLNLIISTFVSETETENLFFLNSQQHPLWFVSKAVVVRSAEVVTEVTHTHHHYT